MLSLRDMRFKSPLSIFFVSIYFDNVQSAYSLYCNTGTGDKGSAGAVFTRTMSTMPFSSITSHTIVTPDIMASVGIKYIMSYIMSYIVIILIKYIMSRL
ncbi:hypothetical protein GDO81_029644 [Engystomops pustulosus]|uniref:Uncharacterized protein n=1 Tax=Engystomops pustulosus TaxID=76066 RepID=A0AAV6Z1M4_ENGPU|nr:hypothetical protein GDO81_029644 [Engystomops pustulosus]